MNNKRGAVLYDFAPTILELDMDTFIASLLPHLPALPDMKEIMWELIKSGDLVMIDQGDNERFFWTAFATEVVQKITHSLHSPRSMMHL